MPDTSTLCDVCRGLDVRASLVRPDLSRDYELGAWQDIQRKRASCPLCACIVSAVQNGPAFLYGRVSHDTELAIFSSPTGARHCGASETEPPQRTFRLQILTEDSTAAGDLLLDGNDAHCIDRTPLFNGRVARPDSVDFDLVRSWIEECHQQHTECGSIQPLEASGIALPQESMLIDVEQDRPVNAEASHRYAALSYVWGDSMHFLLKREAVVELQAPSSLSKLPIPMTVRDAMTVTKTIGLRYLWVDALCIVQDDDAIETKVVAYMHHVYGGAVVTMVAAEGAHADAGLPGVRSGTRHLQQTVAQVAGLRLMPRLCHLDPILYLSKYKRRGWTLQEACLSGRLLYVTAKGVTFHCSRGVHTEEMAFEDELCGKPACHDHTTYLSLNQHSMWRDYVNQSNREVVQGHVCTCGRNNRARFLSYQLPIVTEPPTTVHVGLFPKACGDCFAFRRATEMEFYTYAELVRTHTRRHVSYETDRIPAFAGIAGLLGGRFASNFIYDMPEKHLDFAMLWRPLRNSLTPCRRAGLAGIPSWGWASHEIATGHSGDNWMVSEVDWYALDGGNRLRPIHSLKSLGVAMPMREDFTKPVSLDQLHTHGLLGPSTAGSLHPELVLVGWCQIAAGFFTKGHQLYSPEKQLVYMPSKAPLERHRASYGRSGLPLSGASLPVKNIPPATCTPRETYGGPPSRLASASACHQCHLDTEDGQCGKAASDC
ncbi:hypothetical protein LTR85_007584 [Meristemomyces frigidus]|nr:hypothetical protein LTR85_007584 [Meristemomyces frigidus]